VKLTVKNHDRDAAGLRYVYPVVSRRARGVSVGVNLNPNNACNWRCIYCQVPDLTRGRGPEIDLVLLEAELRQMLDEIVHGDFMERHVPSGARRLNDVALSGNGEPTASRQFGDAVEIIARVLDHFSLIGEVKSVLITNGSLLQRSSVERAIRRLAEINGEIWFKLDSATAGGMRAVNLAPPSPERHLHRLRSAAALCPTWIQTCMFAWRGAPPSDAEQRAYLDCIRELVRDAVPIEGVLLYGLSRRPQRAEASQISALSPEWMEDFARRIEALGVPVRLSV
jgi:wyosine [tRNA(Phe)-imidazoG37] synthetase (radical SAM superfamily)